jgi:hypothetical protein
MPAVRLVHQISVALVPQLISMRQGVRHMAARRFDDVLAQHVAVERRQLAMPVDDVVIGSHI